MLLAHIGEAVAAYPERIWIGSRYADRKILVLGESWYGDYVGDLVTDDGYVRAYLDGRQADAMYTRMANASGLGKQAFWQGIAFTNFVQRVGDTRDCRPTPAEYRQARERLDRLLQTLSPCGVWILGIGQSEYSAPIIREAGIDLEVSAHPTSYGLSNAVLGASWRALVDRTCRQNRGL